MLTRRHAFALCLTPVLDLTATGAHAQAVAPTARIYSALLHKGAEHLDEQGVERLPIIYESALFTNHQPEAALDKDRLLKAVADTLKSYKTGRICLDIERWKLFTDAGTSIPANFERYRDTLDLVKQAFPEVSFGFYGISPVIDYWSVAPAAQNPQLIANWRQKSYMTAQANSRSQLLFCPVYTFYDDIDGWLRYASHRLRLAREIAAGREVFMLMWPNFHEGGKYKDNRLLPIEMWRRQLKWAEDNFANILLWGGWDGLINGPAKFDARAPWWLEVEHLVQTSPIYKT